jgi:hypothetical protein
MVQQLLNLVQHYGERCHASFLGLRKPGLRIRITLVRIRILLLILMRRICDRRSTEPSRLHFEPPSLHCERQRSSVAPFEPPPLMNFCFDPDPDPASDFGADTDSYQPT